MKVQKRGATVGNCRKNSSSWVHLFTQIRRTEFFLSEDTKAKL
jgi:hypothetical protein